MIKKCGRHRKRTNVHKIVVEKPEGKTTWDIHTYRKRKSDMLKRVGTE
jgi:hypothetical protein